MLDVDADRIRADRLREFIEERKRAAENERVEALEEGEEMSLAVTESTGKIEAYEEILRYVDANSTGRSPGSLDEIRE
jgi:hypothetical protein